MRICHVAPELLPVPPTTGGAIERWIRDAAVRLHGARPRGPRHCPAITATDATAGRH